MSASTTFNDTVIAEFRATGGRVDSAGFGDRLVLLHTTGRRSGHERINPVMAIPDGDAWLVTASAAGAPKDPGWALNLRAHPATTIETGRQTVPVTATELDGPEHAAAWKRFTDLSDAFAQYQQRATTRRLPIFRLQPTNASGHSPARIATSG
jgi:deazaflavin-dependent oxidoreductase (nitroreductase family)